ncbi:flavin reductase family protein [Venenivibrio stagnispumantis]|uniref:NADH-FMN oxidoreductase RutF, flavin reductase (DIM6/NTAB) family n=1 Tax=Venenivibrio stagnispumantis TaxID=407998 RepID=A0AA45WJX8_9AQUI|nr:flavin reductase family protein [Venenivibrio stagnispumantis]MCW4572927.1 flavin reductase family protein [Venenivibrio stagnispumantis]SMP04689.1 NADH-FMN oxidoreductase RutF, flavin reductase (DIM6/NTAB) family [Venenivibrio stagnispumantis]
MILDIKNLDESQIYKLMISTIVPRPIAWVSTVSKEGIYNIAPFSFYMGISSSPPLIAISIGKKNDITKKDTWKNIEEVGDFVINIVDYDLVEKMNITALPFDEHIDEFKEAGLTPIKSDIVKSPRIAESPINIECKKFAIIEIADMGLIIGEILRYHIRDDLINEKGYVDTSKLKIVGRLGSADYCLITKENIFTLKRPDKG